MLPVTSSLNPKCSSRARATSCTTGREEEVEKEKSAGEVQDDVTGL